MNRSDFLQLLCFFCSSENSYFVSSLPVEHKVGTVDFLSYSWYLLFTMLKQHYDWVRHLFYGVQFESLTSRQMTNTIQKKFKVSSTQLLYQSCPYQALTLFVVGPFLDGFLTNKNVFAFEYTPQVLVSGELGCTLIVDTASCVSSFALVISAVFHRAVVPNISVGKLQHFPCDWEDISCNLPSPWSSEDMLGSCLWLCLA